MPFHSLGEIEKETDLDIPSFVVEKISRIPGVLKVTYLNA